MTREMDTWLRETVSDHIVQEIRVSDIVYSTRSDFQQIEVLDTVPFGRALMLDGKIQSTELDEFIYHEILVHPPMITHPSPKRIFIAGGGEGATLREVLAHNTVKSAVMVDIDREVVEASKKYLPSWHQGSFDDHRAELHHSDAGEYLKNTNSTFDVIIIDLADPVEDNPSRLLYTKEFYEQLQDRLAPQGVIAVQAEFVDFGMAEAFTAICNTLQSVFSKVYPYHISIPSFTGDWGFAMVSTSRDPMQFSPEDIDQAISARINKPLKVYDGITHRGIFALPKHLREQLKAETKVITAREPLIVA